MMGPDKNDKADGGQPNRADYNDPDAENSEQTETGTQAQDVARDAQYGDDDVSEDSEKGTAANPAQIIPDDVPDLVDKMEEMFRSGRIDMGGFAGEENMDDEDGDDYQDKDDE